MTPVFSIVIATYNRAHSLPKAVSSVLTQTYQDFELIIVDDGSTDDTASYVRTLTDSRIRYIRLPENQGASAARNRGIDEARGEYVMVWDSDDELYPHALAKVKNIFEKHTDAGIVSAPAIPLKEGKEEPYTVRDDGFITLPQILCKYLPNNEKVRAAKRELYKDARYYARNLDFMVNGYLARQAPWYHMREPLGLLHTDNPDSLTRKRKKRSATRAKERAGHLARYIEDFGHTLSKIDPKRLAALAYGAAFGFFLLGDLEKAKHFSLHSCLRFPAPIRHVLLFLIVRTPIVRKLISMLY